MKVVGIGTELSVGKVVDITNSGVIIEKSGRRTELSREEVERLLKYDVRVIAWGISTESAPNAEAGLGFVYH